MEKNHVFQLIFYSILILIVNVNSNKIEYSSYSEDDKSINITLITNIQDLEISYYYNPIQHLSIIKSIEPIPIIRNNIPFKCGYLLDNKGYQINLINLKDDFGTNDFYNNIICNATSNKITENSIQLKGNDINTTYEFICIDDNDNINNNDNIDNIDNLNNYKNNNNNNSSSNNNSNRNNNNIDNIDNIDNLIINSSDYHGDSNNSNNSNNNNSNEIDKFFCLKNDLSNHTLCTYNSKYACLQSIIFNVTRIKRGFSINKNFISSNPLIKRSNIISINGFYKSIYLERKEKKIVGEIKSLNGIVTLSGIPFFREKLSNYSFIMGDNILPISEYFENDFQYREDDNVLISMETNQTILNLTRYSDNILKVQLEGIEIKEFEIDTQNKMILSIEELNDTKQYIQINCEGCIGAQLRGLTMDIGQTVNSTSFKLYYDTFTLYSPLYLQSPIAPFETSNLVIVKPIYDYPIKGEVLQLKSKRYKNPIITVSGYYLPSNYGFFLFTPEFLIPGGAIIRSYIIKSTNIGSYWQHSIELPVNQGSGEFRLYKNNFIIIDGKCVTTTRDGAGYLTISGQSFNYYLPVLTIEEETSWICGNISIFPDIDQLICKVNKHPIQDRFYNVVLKKIISYRSSYNSEPFLMNYLPSGWKCPNNCSGNGHCDGSLNCICDEGFSGYDCSILINQVLTNANSLPISTNQQRLGSFSMTGNHLNNMNFQISLVGIITDSDTNLEAAETSFKYSTKNSNSVYYKDSVNGFTLDAKNSNYSISATAQFNPNVYLNNSINYNGIYLDKLSNNSVYLKVNLTIGELNNKDILKVIYKVNLNVNNQILGDLKKSVTISSPINNKILIKHLDSCSCLQIHLSNRFINNGSINDGYASLVKMESITEQDNSIYFSIEIPINNNNINSTSGVSLEVTSSFSVFNEIIVFEILGTDGNSLIIFGIVVSLVLLFYLMFGFKRNLTNGILNGKTNSFELLPMNGDDLGAPDDDCFPEKGYIFNPNDINDSTLSDILVNEFIESKATCETD
ncbi:hypothetical protein ACTFIT_005962 [Dictyostelium discoideum]